MSEYNTQKVKTEELPRLVGEIIETFEALLEAKGINIPNPEKEEAIADGEDADSICIIYGSDYGELQTNIEEIIMNWKLAEPYD